MASWCSTHALTAANMVRAGRRERGCALVLVIIVVVKTYAECKSLSTLSATALTVRSET